MQSLRKIQIQLQKRRRRKSERMDQSEAPTKGNLMNMKSSLDLATMGYGLMDKKRDILLNELMGLMDEAKSIQGEIDATYRSAYAALEEANIELGIDYVQEIGASVPVDDRVQIKVRSVMGAEVPLVKYDEQPLDLTYGFYNTNVALDEARAHFEKVKELTIRLSMVETSAYRLANAIKKTQKRANALNNITIPHYQEVIRNISDELEEKDREEFTRLKLIKRNKNSKNE